MNASWMIWATSRSSTAGGRMGHEIRASRAGVHYIGALGGNHNLPAGLLRTGGESTR